ncbi:MAG: methanogenesis marker 8 protein [bacterium]
MKIEEIFQELKINKEKFEDLHITRKFSSLMAISNGKVIAMTDPWMKNCLLFDKLNLKINDVDKNLIKDSIKQAVEEKIEKFGSFTAGRELEREDIAVPYGASEMMMYAIKKGGIDAAVTVCDGAGTVISDSPSLIQGIGARMNGLFYTTPIPDIIKGIEDKEGIVVFPDTAGIDQIAGLKKAAENGYKKIAVTINGFMDDDISCIPVIEKEYGIKAVIIIVCTTGISKKRIDHLARWADLIWSCASGEVREIAGRLSILQISLGIPVFVLTQKGLDFTANYSSEPDLIRGLALNGQYLISNKFKGISIKMGDIFTYLSKSNLPVRSKKEPG